jgi:Ser/Thr protein kinase RdoA (MazF antagonist)
VDWPLDGAHALGGRAKCLCAHRPALNLHTFGEASRDLLMNERVGAPEVAQQWLGLCNQALEMVQANECPRTMKLLRLHGDCHPGNILWTPEGLPEAWAPFCRP